MMNKNNNKQRQLTMTTDDNQKQRRRPTTMTNIGNAWVIKNNNQMKVGVFY
jgi:hypothetical protein